MIDLSGYFRNVIDCYKEIAFNFILHFLLWGSRKSGKSWFVVDYIFFCCIFFPGLRVLLLRCYAAKIRKTTFANYKNAIDRLGLRSLIKIDNETKIEFYNGSVIEHSGMLGNEASLKDSEYDCFVYEEAEQSLRSHYTALVNNLRNGQTGLKKSLKLKEFGYKQYTFHKKLIMCLNPPESPDHFINKMFQDQENFPRIKFLKTTIDNNPFATKEDYEELEAIKFFDEHDYKRLRLGLCLPRSQGLLFKENQHFSFVDKEKFEYLTGWTKEENEILSGAKQGTLEELQELGKRRGYLNYLTQIYGMDFSEGTGGDPEVIIQGWVNFAGRIITLTPKIWDNTLSDPKRELKAMQDAEISQAYPIYADASRKKLINGLFDKGYKIYPVDTVNPSILDTIKLLKEFAIYIYIPAEFDRFEPKYYDIKQQYKMLPLRQQIPLYSRKYDTKLEYFKEEPETDAKNMGIDWWDTVRYLVFGYMKMYGVRLQ